MLTIVIPSCTLYDEKTETFLTTKETEIHLEHSLLSLSKWEARNKKPFLSKVKMTKNEFNDYVKCMSIGSYDPTIFSYLTEKNKQEIMSYIEDPMSATKLEQPPNGRRNRETQTAEMIYCRMIQNSIPLDFQKWHLNRLIVLIRICEDRNNPGVKMSESEINERNEKLNAERRKQYNTGG